MHFQKSNKGCCNIVHSHAHPLAEKHIIKRENMQTETNDLKYNMHFQKPSKGCYNIIHSLADQFDEKHIRKQENM